MLLNSPCSFSILHQILFVLLCPGSQNKSSYVIPFVVVAVVLVLLAAFGLVIFKLRANRQRNGRMKLKEDHADTLPHSYPQEKTFENPIYQVSIFNPMIFND